MNGKRFSYGAGSTRTASPTPLARIRSLLPAGLARRAYETDSSASPLPNDAVTYFRVFSFHETTLAVHAASGMVVCAPDEPREPDYLPLAAFRLESRPDLLFFAADTESTKKIGLQFSAIRTVLLPVHASEDSRSDRVVLHDPLHGRFLSAPPLRSRNDLACVTASRDRVNDWERFRLVRQPAQNVSAAVPLAARSIARLVGKDINAESVLDFIEAADSAEDGSLLDSILPFLGIEDLTTIAGRLIGTGALASRLASISPDDVWASAALPDLARWLPSRSPAVRQAHPQRGPSNQRVIGVELDRLATDGEGGQFASFAHACTAMARRAVEPGRSACIVMSARNEGIYLLEWIAYHRAVGFEHFFIYSNNNDDRSDELLAALADAKVITWIGSELSAGVPAQNKAYGHAFGMLPDVLDFKWALVVDADELFVPNPERFGSVQAFIDWQEKRAVDAIALNWQFIGSNDEIGCLDELMTRRNTRLVGIPLIGDGHRLIKTMFRPQKMIRSRSHTPVCDERSSFVYRLSTGDIHAYRNNPAGFHSDPGFSDTVNTENACIYHYFFKSAEEWLWKSSRNRGDHPMSVEIPVKMFTDEWIRNFMRQADVAPEAFINRVPAYAGGMDAELAYLRSLPGVSDRAEAVKQAFRDRIALIKTTIRSSALVNELDETSRAFLSRAGVI